MLYVVSDDCTMYFRHNFLTVIIQPYADDYITMHMLIHREQGTFLCTLGELLYIEMMFSDVQCTKQRQMISYACDN